MMKRKKGYYWVNLRTKTSKCTGFIICEWDGSFWNNNGVKYPDSEVAELIMRPIIFDHKEVRVYKIKFTNRHRKSELKRKYHNKGVTLPELGKIIEELRRVIFDGETITVFNNLID